MKNLLLLLCWVVFWCNGMTGATAAVPSVPVWNPDDTALMADNVASAAAHAINGVETDLHDHGHCAQDLLATLPKVPANDQVRLNAQSLCVGGYENHDRPKAACDVLIHGLKAEQ